MIWEAFLEMIDEDAWPFVFPFAVLFSLPVIFLNPKRMFLFAKLQQKASLMGLFIEDTTTFEEWSAQAEATGRETWRMVRGLRIVFAFIVLLMLFFGGLSLWKDLAG